MCTQLPEVIKPGKSFNKKHIESIEVQAKNWHILSGNVDNEVFNHLSQSYLPKIMP